MGFFDNEEQACRPNRQHLPLLCSPGGLISSLFCRAFLPRDLQRVLKLLHHRDVEFPCAQSEPRTYCWDGPPLGAPKHTSPRAQSRPPDFLATQGSPTCVQWQAVCGRPLAHLVLLRRLRESLNGFASAIQLYIAAQASGQTCNPGLAVRCETRCKASRELRHQWV